MVILARCRPGDVTSSWVCEGILRFLLGNTPRARALRRALVFMVLPMPAPDGVIAGCSKVDPNGGDYCSCWADLRVDTHPALWELRKLLRALGGAGRLAAFLEIRGRVGGRGVSFAGWRRETNTATVISHVLVPRQLTAPPPTPPVVKSRRASVVMWKRRSMEKSTLESLVDAAEKAKAAVTDQGGSQDDDKDTSADEQVVPVALRHKAHLLVLAAAGRTSLISLHKCRFGVLGVNAPAGAGVIGGNVTDMYDDSVHGDEGTMSSARTKETAKSTGSKKREPDKQSFLVAGRFLGDSLSYDVRVGEVGDGGKYRNVLLDSNNYLR